MTNKDDLLEKSIQALERGQTPGQVTSSLPPEAEDLGELVHMAARVRNVSHPSPAMVTRPVRAGASHRIGQQWSSQPGSVRLPKLNHFATAGLLAALLLLVAFGAWMGGPSGADVATLADTSGQVEVLEAGQTEWHPVQPGDYIRRGQQIRTGSGSSATLVFFEGSRTMLAGGTRLAVQQLDGGWGSALRLELDQQAGRTVHAVIPLRGSSSYFRVQTPTGKALVHGTRFEVAVQPQGQSRFAVSSGKVEVDYKGEQVFITSGQTALASRDAALSDPSYQFTVSGPVEAINEAQWTVSGVAFQVDATTIKPADIAVGTPVWVSGRILADNTRVADRIETSQPENEGTVLTGEVEVITKDMWVVSDIPILISPETQIPEGLKAGDVVRITFQVLADGRWQAQSVELLAQTVDPVQVTVTPPAHPELEIQPEEIELNSCNTEFSLPAALFNQAGEENTAASNLKLGYLVEDGQSVVETVDLLPESWVGLPADQKADFTVGLKLVPDWFEQVNKVKLRVYIAAEDHRDDYGTKLTVTIESCRTEETPTVTATPGASETPTVTPTGTQVTPTATEDPDEDDGERCTGTESHPTGMRLAEEHQVSYEEIMSWFCQRPANGFGEIDLAYNLAEEYNLPVEEIFAMRDQQMGWGQIKKALAATAEPGQEDLPPGQQKTKQNKPDHTKLPPGLAKTPKPRK